MKAQTLVKTLATTRAMQPRSIQAQWQEQQAIQTPQPTEPEISI